MKSEGLKRRSPCESTNMEKVKVVDSCVMAVSSVIQQARDLRRDGPYCAFVSLNQEATPRVCPTALSMGAYSPGASFLLGMERAANGAWFGRDGPRGTRVSGVWLFNDLSAYTAALRRHTIYFNPWAAHPLPESLMKFPSAVVRDGRVLRSDGVGLRETFALPEGWPEVD